MKKQVLRSAQDDNFYLRVRRGWAWPLVPVYAAGLWVKDGLRRMGLLKVRKLTWPVVSVGSLSAGGAGKTPVVIALAELLQGRGWGVDVLSRGYGRMGEGVERVDADGVDADGRFGDEPVVIGRRTGVPVWVGSDRYAAGVGAEGGQEQNAGILRFAQNDKQKNGQGQKQMQEQGQQHEQQRGVVDPTLRDDAAKDGAPGAFVVGEGQEQRQRQNAGVLRCAQNDTGKGTSKGCVHLLDDGFQHRGLGRAVDVVLVTEEDLEDALLPAGNRREGLRALRRADVVVLREEERGRVEGRVRRWMREDAVVWSVRRELRFGAGQGESQSLQRRGEGTEKASAGLRVVAFCGIARPEGFWMMLAAAGCELAGRVAFGDHHGYTKADVERLVKVAGECGATGFITTEKDAVKLTAELRAELEAMGPVCVARLDAVFLDEASVMRDLEARIG